MKNFTTLSGYSFIRKMIQNRTYLIWNTHRKSHYVVSSVKTHRYPHRASKLGTLCTLSDQCSYVLLLVVESLKGHYCW